MDLNGFPISDRTFDKIKEEKNTPVTKVMDTDDIANYNAHITTKDSQLVLEP